MPIGAVLVVDPAATQSSADTDGLGGLTQAEVFSGFPISCLDILGSSVLHRMVADWRRLDLGALAVVADQELRPLVLTRGLREASMCPVVRGADLWPCTEQVLAEFAACGIDTALVARVGAYAEVDVHDLLRFHKESGSATTRVHGGAGPLDLWVVETARPALGYDLFTGHCQAAPTAAIYEFPGHVNRLATVRDMRRLVKDAFLGHCALRPQGVEVRPGIWMAEGVSVHHSARLVAPVYLGEGVQVGEGSLITRFSTVERGSRVDSGTTVENASVLPYTYLGMGLDVAHALVHGDHYVSFTYDGAVNIADPKIIANLAPARTSAVRAERAVGGFVGDLLRGLLGPEFANSIGLAAERNISAS